MCLDRRQLWTGPSSQMLKVGREMRVHAHSIMSSFCYVKMDVDN